MHDDARAPGRAPAECPCAVHTPPACLPVCLPDLTPFPRHPALSKSDWGRVCTAWRSYSSAPDCFLLQALSPLPPGAQSRHAAVLSTPAPSQPDPHIQHGITPSALQGLVRTLAAPVWLLVLSVSVSPPWQACVCTAEHGCAPTAPAVTCARSSASPYYPTSAVQWTLCATRTTINTSTTRTIQERAKMNMQPQALHVKVVCATLLSQTPANRKRLLRVWWTRLYV